MNFERIVVDTNVLVSATFWKGDSYYCLERILKNRFQMVLSPFILEEYELALLTESLLKKIERKQLTLLSLLKNLMDTADVITPLFIPKIILDDPDDDNILACALTAKIILSQDKHLLTLKKYKGIKIITSEQFLNVPFDK